METAYHPTMILSENTKTGYSINLPLAGHCRPTKNCAFCCYARTGHTALPTSKRKQVWVSNYLKGPDISELIEECKNQVSVRISGTGDLSLEHCPNILKLARSCPSTQFWGMTRKLEVARALNGHRQNLKFMVSVDASSPKSVWKYKGKLCWGPRLAGDTVPKKDRRILVIFPYHKAGRVVAKAIMPKDVKDCPAIWHRVSGCRECGKCFNWKG